MFETVAVPYWLLLLIVAFAALSFLSHFLFPSVRWFFRRRMEKAVAQLNTRLGLPIQPFKLMRRNDMIVRLVYDPKVLEAVAAEAAESGEPQSVVHERARRYAREIVPAFSASLYFGVATRLAKWLARLIYRVRIGHLDADELRAIDRNATVVFVMNHRSNMDYVLVTYLAASQTSLSYAVGEWARIWPLSALIRSMGAYFIRRRSNGTLYRRVLARYVQLATEEGVTQAVFPEGGLSLDGRVGAAKLGILSYIVSGFRADGRDVIFIPVALNYDRVLEDRVLIGAAEAGVRRFRASIPQIMMFLLRNLWRRLRGRFRKFGYAAVSFGTPVSLRAVMTGGSEGATERLAELLMRRVQLHVPVLPVPLVAAALDGREKMDTLDLRRAAVELLDRIEADGTRPGLPLASVEAAVEAGVETLGLRRILHRDGDGVRVSPGQEAILRYYAASVLQHLEAGVETSGGAEMPRQIESVTT